MATTTVDPARAEPIGGRGLIKRADGILNGWRLLLVAATAYLAYALFVTWPLATNPSGLLSAPNFLEDAAGTTSYMAYLVSHHIVPFAPAHMTGLNAPEGFNQTWALNLAQAPCILLMWLPSVVFGAVAGGNLFMLLGFVASGTSMFAFIRRLFGSRIVALLAGFAFAFYPFPVSAASVHYPFVHGWPMVLCVWGLLEMAHSPNRRNALVAGAATAFAMWWNPYYELFAGFALAVMVLITFALGVARGQRGVALRAAGTALLPVAALGAYFVVLLKLAGGLSAVGTVPRPISEVYAFSAHLWDYLLPGPYSAPLIARVTTPVLSAHRAIADTWDSAVYPGYVVMLLAVAGFVTAVAALRSRAERLSDIRTVAVLSAGALAVVAFVSSAPPTVTVLGVQIAMPSHYVYSITPTWQTFARFVILLELALVIMMAAALARLRRSLDPRRSVLVFALIALLLGVDLWAQPPRHTIATRPAPAYAWLRAHPGGIIADYPLLPAYDPATASALFWGGYTGHPLFQGYWGLSTSESMKLDLADLAAPQTAAKLASYGVRYIVVHPGTPGGSPRQLRARGYKPVLRDAHHAGVWEVTSVPAQTAVDARSGFDWISGFPTYDRRLLLGSGVLALSAGHCSSCTGTVRFDAGGVGRVTRLIVRSATGTVLAIRELRPHRQSPVTVDHVQLVRGQAELTLQTSPAADAVIGMRAARLTITGRPGRKAPDPGPGQA